MEPSHATPLCGKNEWYVWRVEIVIGIHGYVSRCDWVKLVEWLCGKGYMMWLSGNGEKETKCRTSFDTFHKSDAHMWNLWKMNNVWISPLSHESYAYANVTSCVKEWNSLDWWKSTTLEKWLSIEIVQICSGGHFSKDINWTWNVRSMIREMFWDACLAKKNI